MLLTLESTVTVEALRAALTAIVDTHDALRLRFVLDDGEWRAVTDPAPNEPQLTVHPPGADLAVVAADGHAALDLAAGPVFRAELLPGTPNRLLLIAHHLVIDVVSWQIIVSDLATALDQAGIGDPPQLPPVPTSWSTLGSAAERLGAGRRGRRTSTLVAGQRPGSGDLPAVAGRSAGRSRP